MKNTQKRVFIQVKTQIGYSGSKHKVKWTNYKGCGTYEEAVAIMRNLQSNYPEAILRIKNDNEYTY